MHRRESTPLPDAGVNSPYGDMSSAAEQAEIHRDAAQKIEIYSQRDEVRRLIFGNMTACIEGAAIECKALNSLEVKLIIQVLQFQNANCAGGRRPICLALYSRNVQRMADIIQEQAQCRTQRVEECRSDAEGYLDELRRATDGLKNDPC